MSIAAVAYDPPNCHLSVYQASGRPNIRSARPAVAAAAVDASSGTTV